ncbi:MAG: DUF5615 family PIN-like protein [Haloarculaceae archaeon]
MAVRFLLDENMEPRVYQRLEQYGYDVVSVGEVETLGLGAQDGDIANYSKQTERVLLTYDDDFVIEHEASEFHCVVFFEEQSLAATDVADIAHSMATAYPESAFDGYEYGSREWL